MIINNYSLETITFFDLGNFILKIRSIFAICFLSGTCLFIYYRESTLTVIPNLFANSF